MQRRRESSDASPATVHCGSCAANALYTPEERRRRDASSWTVVQGVLAPLQFLVFLVSAWLLLHFLWTGEGFELAAWSVVFKTAVLYTIMVTGSVWEKEVFGVWLFARPFFWEDVFSFLVLALHTAYLIAMFTDALTARDQALLALAAYAAYVVNATQFLLKLRAARLQAATQAPVNPPEDRSTVMPALPVGARAPR